MRLLRLPDVCVMTGLPRATVYAWARLDRFPSPIKLGERSSAWRLDEIERWVEERTKDDQTSARSLRVRHANSELASRRTPRMMRWTPPGWQYGIDVPS